MVSAYIRVMAVYEQYNGVMAKLLNDEPEAMIGEVAYQSFKEAMMAVQDGETIVLQKDVNSDGMYVLQDANDQVKLKYAYTSISANDITVDLNGYTITATGTATQSDEAYGVFRMRNGHTLTLSGGGVIDGKVVNSTGGTLNLNGSVEIKGRYNSYTIANYGDININASISKLTVTAYTGNVTVGENGSAVNLTVNMPAPTKNDNNWERSLTVNGPVTNLTVDQKTAHSMYPTRITHSELTVNAPVETLKLTQGQAGGSYRADLWNKAYINAPVGTMTVSQSGKISELYMNSTVDTLDLTLFNKNYSDLTSDVPVTQAGPGFQAGQLNFARLNLVNFASPSIRDGYANPMTPVEDLVLVTGMDGHEITADQVGATAWGMGNTSSGLGGGSLEYTDPASGIKANYKYLTTAQVINGQIVLHKTVLTGIPKVVYLNGTKGNDAKNGLTTANAVKTFARAAELLGTEDGLKTIYVTGTVTISKDEAWALAGSVNGTVKRYSTFKSGALINVKSGSLTLSNIIIDGGKEENVSASSPLVTVQAGAALTVNEGAVLQNNANTGSVRGGAINNKGALTINGGLIQNNSTVESGGGIYSTGHIAMNGGEISGNKSTAWSGAANSKSTGGGICLGPKGTMDMTDGTIANNATVGFLAYGGGIALGDCANRTGMKLNMSGGTIKGNRATGNGGGIAVWTGGEAEITGGYIVENNCNYNNANWTLSYFGGGGIYVNKGATLTLKTVEVTGNKASTGKGIACCPTSNMRFFVKNGGVFYGNGSSIWLSTSTGGQNLVPVSITNYTLNGYKYNWTDGDGNPVDVEKLNCVIPKGSGLGLNSGLTDAQGRDAASYCDLHITGNISGKWNGSLPGGGIGCNGTLIIGEDTSGLALEKKVEGGAKVTDETFDFTIAFTTGDGNAYDGSVTMWKDGAASTETLVDGELKLTLKKDGYVLFQDLPVGLTYTITEGANNADMVVIGRTTVTDLDNLDSYQNPTIKWDNVPGATITGGVVDGLDEVVYTNVYDSIGLTIKKVVESENEADKAMKFPFEIKLLNQNGELYYATNATEGEDDLIGLPVSFEYTLYTDGEETEKDRLNFNTSVASFELAHNQSIVIKKLPVGATALVTELDTGRVGFWTMVDFNGEPTMSNVVGVQTGAGENQVVTFTNHRYAPGELPIPFAKQVTGNPSETPAFRFTLTADGNNDTTGYVLPADTTVTLENISSSMSGNGAFNIKFVKAGTYRFTIAEDTSNVGEGWTYDTAKWTVTVTVTESEIVKIDAVTQEETVSNGLVAEITSVEKDGAAQDKDTGIVFTNAYEQPKPLDGSLTITKVIRGGGSEAQNKTYTFTVTGPDGYNRTVTITGEGSVTLSPLTPGVYTVTEDRDGAVISGYTLTISGSGSSAEVVAGGSADVTITNTYTTPGDPGDPEDPEEPEDPETPTPPPTPEIPDEEVPLTDIPEEEVPLAEIPEELEIPEEEVPLADVPETGDLSGNWMMAMLMGALGMIWMALTGKKRSEEEG